MPSGRLSDSFVSARKLLSRTSCLVIVSDKALFYQCGPLFATVEGVARESALRRGYQCAMQHCSAATAPTLRISKHYTHTPRREQLIPWSPYAWAERYCTRILFVAARKTILRALDLSGSSSVSVSCGSAYHACGGHRSREESRRFAEREEKTGARLSFRPASLLSDRKSFSPLCAVLSGSESARVRDSLAPRGRDSRPDGGLGRWTSGLRVTAAARSEGRTSRISGLAATWLPPGRRWALDALQVGTLLHAALCARGAVPAKVGPNSPLARWARLNAPLFGNCIIRAAAGCTPCWCAVEDSLLL